MVKLLLFLSDKSKSTIIHSQSPLVKRGDSYLFTKPSFYRVYLQKIFCIYSNPYGEKNLKKYAEVDQIHSCNEYGSLFILSEASTNILFL